MSIYDQFYIIKNNRIKLLSVVSIGIVASPITAISNQTLTQNDAGVIILEGATIIDGTGALPKPNTTIVINGNRIAYLSSNIANN